MKCDDCGEKLTERIGDTEMDEGGVKVKLEGVRIFTCPKCKREMHTIPKMEALFREIATTLARKRQRLMPQEIRFLRKYLGLSSKDFASKIGVDHTTVSKWERVDEPQGMGPVAERLLRMFVLYEKPVDEYPLEEMGAEAAAPAHPTMVHDQRGWHPRAA